MDRNEEVNAKMLGKANQEVGGAVRGLGRITDPVGMAGEYRPSEREQAEKRVGHHRIEADRADRAAAFFREHPEFDEFIGLIRAGIIQI